MGVRWVRGVRGVAEGLVGGLGRVLSQCWGHGESLEQRWRALKPENLWWEKKSKDLPESRTSPNQLIVLLCQPRASQLTSISGLYRHGTALSRAPLDSAQKPGLGGVEQDSRAWLGRWQT